MAPPTKIPLPTAHLTPALLVDVALLSLGGAVALFFVWRYVVGDVNGVRRPASLAIAWLMPTGWGLVALIDLGLVAPEPDLWRLLGCLGFISLLFVVLRSEVVERRPERRKGPRDE